MIQPKLHQAEQQRNYGFWNEAEQEAMNNTVIAFAGAGGDGQDLARAIVMAASPKEVRIADPETFAPENSNRVAWANQNTYGRNKAEVLAEDLKALRPDTKIVVYEEGVTSENVEEFVRGADLLVDESELTYLHVGTALAREARKNHTPSLVVMNIGFAAIATSFDPDSRHTFEKMMGIPEDAPLDEVEHMKVDYSRTLPYLPGYGDMKALEAVLDGAPLPSIVQGVKMAAGIGSTEAFLHLTSNVGNRRRKPTFAPKWRYSDALTGKSGIIHHPRANYYGRAAIMGLRSQLGMNPETSYTADDRERRGHQVANEHC